MNVLPPAPRRLNRSFVRQRLHAGAMLMAVGVAVMLPAPVMQMQGPRVLVSVLGGFALLMCGHALVRRWWLARDGQEVVLPPPAKLKGLLCVDTWESRAVALTFGTKGERFWVRADFWPLALTADQEREARQRLAQLRDVQKLVTDVYSC